jgi:hypothetical protein
LLEEGNYSFAASKESIREAHGVRMACAIWRRDICSQIKAPGYFTGELLDISGYPFGFCFFWDVKLIFRSLPLYLMMTKQEANI